MACSMFGRMFGKLLAIVTLSSAYELSYKSVLQEGLNGVTANTHSHWRIPAGQDSGEIIYPRDFKCAGQWGPLHAPVMVSVELLDSDNAMKIVFTTDLRRAYIYRSTYALHTEASVKFSFHCRPLLLTSDLKPKSEFTDDLDDVEEQEISLKTIRPINGFV